MGKIVTFEGIDGSGKTYWSNRMATLFGTESINVNKKSIHYANNTYLEDVGKNIGHVLWEVPKDAPIELLDDNGWLFLYLSWLTIFQKNILLPLKEKYRFVFLDGWYYKMLSRFLVKDSFEEEYLMKLFSGLVDPDICFYLDTRIEDCFKRKKNFTKCELGKMDGFEGDEQKCFFEYQNIIRDNYIHILNKRNINNTYIIDSEANECIQDKISDVLNNISC